MKKNHSISAPVPPVAEPSVDAPAEVPAPRPRAGKVQDEPAPLARSYRNWFLDYASYVILDRAVPHLDDGLKPVQRRILHTLWEMDDGRFHKVANVVGRTMSLHPHGDASIGAALVAIGALGVNLEHAIDGQAKGLLGADLIVTSRNALPETARQRVAELSVEQAREVSFSSMAAFPARDGLTRLVNVRALEGAFPFYGDLATVPAEVRDGRVFLYLSGGSNGRRA